jgi:hypothetical protein
MSTYSPPPLPFSLRRFKQFLLSTTCLREGGFYQGYHVPADTDVGRNVAARVAVELSKVHLAKQLAVVTAGAPGGLR